MLTGRWVDRVEMELVNRGEAFFHVGGAGHEASAALAAHLTPSDWLHLHYRDKALMLARGIPPEQFFHSLLCTDASHSRGRQMSAHLSDPALNVLSLVGPVGNNALQAVGVAHELRAKSRHFSVDPSGKPSDQDPTAPGKSRTGMSALQSPEQGPTPPVVVCSMGDGTSQQGEVLEAIAEAVRARLRLLFLIEDNQLAISTKTRGQTFFNLPSGPAAEFYGLPIVRIDARDAWACHRSFEKVLESLRQRQEPMLVVLEGERLTHHTNADDERLYREADDIATLRDAADPIARLGRQLITSGMTRETLDALEREVEASVRAAAEIALAAPDPTVNRDARPVWDVRFPSERTLGKTLKHVSASPSANGHSPAPFSGNGSVSGKFHNDVATSRSAGPSTLLEVMRSVLKARMQEDPRITLFGEDIEDPKGDVFGLTRGLSTAFPSQVQNSALSESTIVGVSIGRALAGGRPVGCIQFADFLPLAYNQIASELGSMFWRTDGSWQAPVILLAPCGGYRPGLGPFHAQTFESTFAHIPGLDVVMPATAADAAGLLNAIFEGGRPTLFLYPKVLLNDASVATTEDLDTLHVIPGKGRLVTGGDDLTLVGWGATVSLCERAAQHLNTAGITVDVIDLRSISPWDRELVLGSVRRTRRLIVVHEDNLTCGFGAEILATVMEGAGVPIQARRVARPDTYVPCNYANQLEVLPSLKAVLACAAKLCDLEFSWLANEVRSDGISVIEAAGSSPADQNVTVIEWLISEGDVVAAGDRIAECEADKATFELRSPRAGKVIWLHPAGDKVQVGTPLVRLSGEAGTRVSNRRAPDDGRPILSPKTQTAPPASSRTTSPLISPHGFEGRKADLGEKAPTHSPGIAALTKTVVGLSGFHFVTGSRRVPNAELLQRFPGKTSADIVQRTGIEERYFCGPDETVLTLAARAARAALRAAGLTLPDLDGILVSTSTPMSISPSLACLLHHELSKDGPTRDIPATDILAACSGWLYALQIAHDQCQIRPESNILVVTSEAMSRFIDPNDFDTAIVFGDAATATIVRGSAQMEHCPVAARLHRPVLSARGEDGSILNVGRIGEGLCRPVEMHGVRVFPLAVRQMNLMLRQACTAAGWSMENLNWIVPHQANGRIIAAAQQRSGVPAERVISNVARFGNTSSSSIPIALAEMLERGQSGHTALAAFGGGFTFAAAMLELGPI